MKRMARALVLAALRERDHAVVAGAEQERDPAQTSFHELHVDCLHVLHMLLRPVLFIVAVARRDDLRELIVGSTVQVVQPLHVRLPQRRPTRSGIDGERHVGCDARESLHVQTGLVAGHRGVVRAALCHWWRHAQPHHLVELGQLHGVVKFAQKRCDAHAVAAAQPATRVGGNAVECAKQLRRGGLVAVRRERGERRRDGHVGVEGERHVAHRQRSVERERWSAETGERAHWASIDGGVGAGCARQRIAREAKHHVLKGRRCHGRHRAPDGSATGVCARGRQRRGQGAILTSQAQRQRQLAVPAASAGKGRSRCACLRIERDHVLLGAPTERGEPGQAPHGAHESGQLRWHCRRG
mmetsp:Transcript_1828/g.5451  ORF Transcript_1828/g.5451 Transcript_1828/m.5451 type:complete len:355 (+) Transcript_1828:327-1391(+)